MAGRTHARLLLTIWADPEWRQLTHLEQWCFEMLISQEGLNNAGVQALRVRRWSNLAADLDETAINQALKGLAARRFVLVDYDTEEVLVRSFMRNDGVTKQPYVMKAALKCAAQVISPELRAELLVELRRIDVSGLNARKKDRPVQEDYDEAIAALVNGPQPPPPNPGKDHGDTQFDTPPHTQSDTPPTPSPTGSRTPSPTPCATPPGVGVGVSSYVTSTEKDIPAAASVDLPTDRAHTRRGSGERTTAAELARTAHRPAAGHLVAAWAEHNPGMTTAKRRELSKAVDTLLSQGADPALIPEALDRAHAAQWRNPLAALPHAYEDTRRAAHPPPVLAATGTTGRIATTTQRVNDALSLLRPEED